MVKEPREHAGQTKAEETEERVTGSVKHSERSSQVRLKMSSFFSAIGAVMSFAGQFQWRDAAQPLCSWLESGDSEYNQHFREV